MIRETVEEKAEYDVVIPEAKQRQCLKNKKKKTYLFFN